MTSDNIDLFADGCDPEHELVIDHFPFVIGREAGSDYQVDYPSISRRHCRLYLVENDVWLQDLESRNGTFLNGERVTKPRMVQDGDMLSLSLHFFRIVLNSSRVSRLPFGR
jgi:pSer/pThr/pTyr-binding forkhead associated (FHA) protein